MFMVDGPSLFNSTDAFASSEGISRLRGFTVIDFYFSTMKGLNVYGNAKYIMQPRWGCMLLTGYYP
jgi:hypothetical protein